MTPSVLVPLDGTPLAETALPLSRLLAELSRAPLELLRVVPVDQPGSADAEALAYLNGVAEAYGGDGVQVVTRVMRGKPGECIAREAAASQVALVAMTTHARSGLRRAVLGSVADEVVARAPPPTLLLRPGTQAVPRLNTLLLAIDGTCAAPLSVTTELAQAAGARVVLLRVVGFEETYIWQWNRGPVLEEPQAVLIARQQLHDIAGRLQEHGVPTELHVAVGSPVPIIESVAEACDADLIIMATHAKRGTERAIQGSVADAVARTARPPVLLCRLVTPVASRPRAIDIVHLLQHLPPAVIPQSIPEPLAGAGLSRGAEGEGSTPAWARADGWPTRNRE